MNTEPSYTSNDVSSRVKTRQQLKGIQPSIQKEKRKYCHISPERKNHLITLVLEKKLRIKDAAIICNLNYSTAKTILYILRHRPAQIAGIRPISNLANNKLTIRVLIGGKIVNEYDFYTSPKLE